MKNEEMTALLNEGHTDLNLLIAMITSIDATDSPRVQAMHEKVARIRRIFSAVENQVVHMEMKDDGECVCQNQHPCLDSRTRLTVCGNCGGKIDG